MPEPLHITIVGGGISGLAAAYALTHEDHNIPLRVTLLEADQRLGGKLRTEPFADIQVDAGPDAFLARQPWAKELCQQLGLTAELVAPATGRAYLWTRRQLRALPSDLILGVPTNEISIAQSGILSLPGIARAGLDLILPRHHWSGGDPTVAEVIGARFGHEVVERLVEPLIGGIHAGRADRLSLMAVAPHLAQAAQQHRSLMLGLRNKQAHKPSEAGPAFLSLRQGLGRLIERLHETLSELDIRLNTQVQTLTRQPDGRYCLQCTNGPAVITDGVLLAVPTWAAAKILQLLAPAVASELAAIQYASVIITTLGYPGTAFPQPLHGNGFLVPRIDQRLLTACTWTSSKWPHLKAASSVILRCSTGRIGDKRAWQLSDDELVSHIHSELVEAMGIRHRPKEVRVTRWERALPQYEAGHQARIARIEEALSPLPGLALAGAAYHGPGIPSCVQDGKRATIKLLTSLTQLDSTLAGD
jgi:oxygen-dependent protoporphyrinogen oxidase